MRRTLAVGFLIFAAVAGFVLTGRLASESLAVIVGVVLGVVAMLPMLILVLVVARRAASLQQPQQQQPQQQQPTVIVVGGQQLPSPQQQPWAVDGQWRPAQEEPAFKMLGED